MELISDDVSLVSPLDIETLEEFSVICSEIVDGITDDFPPSTSAQPLNKAAVKSIAIVFKVILFINVFLRRHNIFSDKPTVMNL